MNNQPTPETKSFYVTAFDVEEWAEKCIRLEKKLDDAREKYATEATDHMLNVNKLCGDCDKAREDLEEETKFHHRTHIELIQTQCKLLDMEMQRDEARNAIEGWENKWKCAVEMAARAELERDDAEEYAKLLSERLTALELESTAELARLEQELINMKELYESNN